MNNQQLFHALKIGTKSVFGIALAAVAVALPDTTTAQGCVAARGAGMTCSPNALHFGENLPPSSGFQMNVGYRWLQSDRHFSGSHENKERQEEGSEVINKSQFTDVTLSYAFNPRFSASFTIPFVLHDRSQVVRSNDVSRTILQRFHTQSSGIGDMRLEGNGWILDPATHMKGNVLLGIGLDMPTGEKDAKDTFQVFKNGQILAEERNVDQSIQPGDGGWGLALSIYGYQQIVPRLNAFVNGAYTITPEEKNGVLTSRSNPFEAEMSIADTYMGRAGLEFVVWPKYGLALSLAGRIEGVPVHDAIGGSDGFRRPGFAISIEPGVMATYKSWSFGIYAPVSLYRNREQSVPDKQYQETNPTSPSRHGDAAFADYLIMFNLTKRF